MFNKRNWTIVYNDAVLTRGFDSRLVDFSVKLQTDIPPKAIDTHQLISMRWSSQLQLKVAKRNIMKINIQEALWYKLNIQATYEHIDKGGPLFWSDEPFWRGTRVRRSTHSESEHGPGGWKVPTDFFSCNQQSLAWTRFHLTPGLSDPGWKCSPEPAAPLLPR